MSYVITEPELVQGAAQDLAGIHSSLAEVAKTAAGPTTGIVAAAQDEVSAAAASFFGNFGEEFQVLNAQAQAFHAEFENLLSSGAAAYVRAEAVNAEQVLTNTVSEGAAAGIGQSVNGVLTALQHGGASLLATGQTGAAAAPGLLAGINSFAATVAGPYQALVSNTMTNLQAIGSMIQANPFLFLHQLANNQISYGQTCVAGLGSAIQNLPAELASLPALQF